MYGNIGFTRNKSSNRLKEKIITAKNNWSNCYDILKSGDNDKIACWDVNILHALSDEIEILEHQLYLES